MSDIKIKVVLAHPDGLLVAGMAAVLANANGIELVGRSESGECCSDVVVTDYEGALNCPEPSRRSAKVLVVTHLDSEARIRQAMERGIRGYLAGPCTSADFLAAVRDVSRGAIVLSREASNRIAESFASEPLTKRQKTVLRALMLGLSNKMIAARLSVSEGTVKTHVKAICAKLNARGRTEAASIGWRRGLVGEPPPGGRFAREALS